MVDAPGSGLDVQIPMTYTDLAPTQIALTMPNSVVSDVAADFQGSFTDPDSSHTHTVTIDWGDDSEPTTVNLSAGVTNFPSEAHTYWGDGSYLVSVTVANANAPGSTEQTTTVNVFDAAPVTNLVRGSFTVDSSGNLSVGYTVNGAAATPFTIGVYSSVDGVQLGNIVQSVGVSDPGLLAVGPHTVTFAVQSGALSGGGYFVADLDVYDQVAETSKTDNESAPLAGVFQASDGSVYVFASSTGPSHTVSVANGASSGSLDATVDTVESVFQNVSYIYATTYRTGDTVNVDSAVQVPFTEFDEASGTVDVGFYLSAAQSARTELDIQAAVDAVHGGTGGASLQLTALQGADQMDVWDSPEGEDPITIVDGVIGNWDFSSTGEASQAVWITPTAGASGGIVLCQVALQDPDIDPFVEPPLPQARTLPPSPATVVAGPSAAPANFSAGGITANYFRSAPVPKSLSINPREITDAGGAQYQYGIGATLGDNWIQQNVAANGVFTVVVESQSGGGDKTFTAAWKEEYGASWYFDFSKSPSTTMHLFDKQNDHVDNPANLVAALDDSNFGNLMFQLGGPTGLQVSVFNASKTVQTTYNVASWEYHLSAVYSLSGVRPARPISQAQMSRTLGLWNKAHPGLPYPETTGTMQNYMWLGSKKATLTPTPAATWFSNVGTLLPQEGGKVVQVISAVPGNQWKSFGSVVAACTDRWDLSWSKSKKGTINASYTTSGYK